LRLQAHCALGVQFQRHKMPAANLHVEFMHYTVAMLSNTLALLFVCPDLTQDTAACMHFQQTGMPCAVFHACEHAGAPVEMDEMAPQWFAFDSIPYQSMWADDPLWYPLVLTGRARFRGTFHFVDTHTLVRHELAEVAQLEEPP